MIANIENSPAMKLLVIDNDKVVYRPKTVREGNAYILGAGRGMLCNVLSVAERIADEQNTERNRPARRVR